MLLTCRKCKQREVAFDGVKGLCPVCQEESDAAKPPHRRGRNDKAVLLIQSKVTPARFPLDGSVFLVLSTAVLAVASEVWRFFAEQERAHQWAVFGTDHYSLQSLQSAEAAIDATQLLRFALPLLIVLAFQRWVRIGHANAMTRADIGLGWLRSLPGGTAIVRIIPAWYVSYVAAVFATSLISRNMSSAGTYRTTANIDAGFNVVFIALAVLLSVLVLAMTRSLNRLLETPGPMAVTVAADVTADAAVAVAVAVAEQPTEPQAVGEQ